MIQSKSIEKIILNRKINGMNANKYTFKDPYITKANK